MVKKPGFELERHIGERLRRRRVEMGLTQDQLARSLGVSYQQVQKYEGGQNRISADRLMGLSKRLEVELPYFFKGFDAASPASTTLIEHGHKSRAAVEVARGLGDVSDADVRTAISALVRTVTERQL